MVLVFGFLQDASVEMKPGKFPIDESVRARGQVLDGDGMRRAGPRRYAESNFFFQFKYFAAICHGINVGVINRTNRTVCRFGDMMPPVWGAASSRPRGPRPPNGAYGRGSGSPGQKARVGRASEGLSRYRRRGRMPGAGVARRRADLRRAAA